MPGIGRGRLEFLPQLQYLVIHGSSRRVRVVTPHFIQKQFAAKDAFGILGEESEQLEFVRCERDGYPSAPCSHLLKVDFAVAKPISRGRRRPVTTANCRLHTRHQFARTERFGDIIVSSKLEQEHLVHYLSDGAQDDYRSVGRDRFHALANVATRYLGKDQVEDHGGGAVRAKGLESGLSVACNNH